MQVSKALVYEYVLDRLLIWFGKERNDFSILKSLKLLFFVSAANTEKYKKSILLEDIFVDYVAMPYGHVESSIYNILRNPGDNLQIFQIDNSSAVYLPNVQKDELFLSIPQNVKDEINSSILHIKKQNPNFVNLPAFDLVNLSHRWYTWQFYFQQAKKNFTRSFPIPAESIKEEDKIFSL